MLHFVQIFQVFSAILIIILVIPQTGEINFLLRKLYEKGVFRSYREGKAFLSRLTWGTIITFLLLTYASNRLESIEILKNLRK